MSNKTSKPPNIEPAIINIAVSSPIITGEPGKRIYVYKHFLKVSGATGLKFQHGVTDFFPTIPMVAGEGWTLDYDTEAWFACGDGEDFKILISVPVQVSGVLYFKKL